MGDNLRVGVSTFLIGMLCVAISTYVWVSFGLINEMRISYNFTIKFTLYKGRMSVSHGK